MRRVFQALLFLILIAFLALSVVTDKLAATTPLQTPDGQIAIPPQENPMGMMVSGAYVPVEVTPLGSGPFGVNLNELQGVTAQDDCGPAAEIDLEAEPFFSSATIVNTFTNESTDPSLLGCMYGQPESTIGYRTAWYRVTAPESGRLFVEASPNFSYEDDYDTVIAIYQGVGCGANLTLQACNDDFNGFLSRTSTYVTEGSTYFIEFADRQLSVQGTAQAVIQAWIDTSENFAPDFWGEETDWNTEQANRSRHAAVASGDDIFVIGGQTLLDRPDTTPIRTPSTARFDTVEQTWYELAPMPPECAFDGYSNQDAALIGNTIYLPSGYVGDSTVHDGTHCAYDISTDEWSVKTAAPWANDVPPVFSAVVPRSSGTGYYVIGGSSGPLLQTSPDTNAYSDVYFYSPVIDNWLTNVPEISGGRYGHTGAMIPNSLGDDQFLCYVGGLRPSTTQTTLLDNGECLDITNPSAGWSPIAAMNIGRYFAMSAISPEGEWYVIGGVTAVANDPNDPSAGVRLAPVPEIEKYDPVNDRWIVFDSLYNLDTPARAWVRGGFVDRTLWVVGGETANEGSGFNGLNDRVTKLVGEVFLPSTVQPNIYLPIVATGKFNGEPNNSFLEARFLEFHQQVFANFDDSLDHFDMYKFTVDEEKPVTILLDHIPFNEYYDLYLYSSNKLLLASSTNLANVDEKIEMTLEPGTYFIKVVAEINAPLVFGDYRVVVID